jgi:glycosyltransferase involved in cell wall biosynthesis
MRLALVSVSDQLGGSEVVLLQIVEHVRRTRPDWSVDVVVPGAGPLAARSAALGARVHALAMPPALARLGEWGTAARPLGVLRQLSAAITALPGYERGFADLLDTIRPDIIHSNGFKAHVVAARARTDAARVWHVHEYVSSRAATRRLLRLYGAVPDAIVANSHSVADDLRRALAGRVRAGITVVHNGVDVERFTPAGPALDLDAASGLAPAAAGAVRVGLVATFARWKGHDVFLRALAGADPAVRGYVVGAPVYDTTGSQWTMEELRSVAADARVEDRAGFAGFQPDVPAVLRALDIVVHASVQPEPFGLVVAEAMACGRPVITTGIGGAAEIVRPGETALTCIAGDPASLASAINTLARDGARRARLGSAGRAVVEEQFTAARFGDAIVAQYEALRGVRAA